MGINNYMCNIFVQTFIMKGDNNEISIYNSISSFNTNSNG